MNLIDDYDAILGKKPPKGRQKEQVVQDFLEEHSELLPTPILLNHKLHFDIVISKMPIGTSYKSDYAYLTKSSSKWNIVFVELEKPEKSIFSSNPTNSDFSNVFYKAIQQVRDWAIYIQDHKKEVVESFKVFLKPLKMCENPIEFKYVLIYGRSTERDKSPERIKQIHQIECETGFKIITYDTIKHDYESIRNKKIIVSPSQSIFKVKSMQSNPMFFADISASELEFSKEQIESLKKEKYDMDSWQKGEPLKVNNKRTMQTLGKDPELLT
jgi:hypothetical protein